MDMEYKQTITLNSEQVKKIIADHVAKVFTLSGDVKVSINVGTSYEDRPMGGSYPTFKDVTVEVTTKGKI